MNLPRCFCLTIASYKERWQRVNERFEAEGLDVIPFNGWDNSIGGLRTTHPYEIDAPGSGFIMGQRQTGIYLGHWMLWNYLNTLSDNCFFIFEDDVLFRPKWRKYLHQDLWDLPADWDLFFPGNCCLGGHNNIRITDTLYKTTKAQCCHAYMVKKRVLPFLLEKCQKVWANIDLALLFECEPFLNTYARIPRLMDQENTEIPP